MKLGFVGAGRVGSTSAFTCLLNLDVDEIALVDIAEDLAVGEAMDLSHAAAGINKYPKIVGGSDYSLLKGSEIIVVTAGLARKPGMTRLDLATKNAGIIRDVANKIAKNAPESKILVVTNPMDVMTYIMWKESGKPRNEVFGMGNQLDSQRLKERLYAAGARNIRRAWIIGEHGDSMFVAKSLADFDGEIDWDAVEKDTRFVAAEVIKRKGATIYGPAVAIYRMVRAVVGDTGEIIPTSVVLQGEYGIENVAVGVPAKLGRDGVEVVNMNLTEEEIEKLKNSARILRERLSELGY
ncbi:MULTISPECIES: malate dehydrogenase [unclassified Archaeoglobus]|jgi:malate dehydrogenase|uniref:malate dehydrogenase n=1 Tax=unclassified Archaeoglobus TaxID=2643606 RepID=UPI0025C320AD|nr:MULTISPECIES: malate dehydrogenase [unclassified Archaeoglobus]